jgi:Glycosyl transferase family 2
MTDAKPPVLAIAAPVRGEAPYLLEWIAYHRVLGIKAFLLGDNTESDDPTSALLQALHERKVVFRFDWRGRTHFQIEFNRQALDAARLFADGIFLIDVDEFLRPAAGRSVLEIAQQWLSDATIGAVALNWAIYGSSDQVAASEGLVIERFTRRAPQDFNINRHAKPFARVSACAGPAGNPHAVALHTGRYTDTLGQDVAWDTSRRDPVGLTTKVIWDVLRVDHFVVKSHAEFLAKQARGSPMLPTRRWDSYFEMHNRNDVVDLVPRELVERTKAEMAMLSAQLADATTDAPAASPASQ